jgi:hypothetical protein
MRFAGRASAVDPERCLVIPGADAREFLAASAIRAADGFLPMEDAMKKWTMFALLSTFACAGVSRASADDALSGPWQGVVRKGMLENVVYFDFSRTDTGYRGNYWGRAPIGTPVSLSGIELGHSVRFEVPQMGVFDGEIAGETMEGTFHDAEGAGSFRLQKQIAWDALPNGP